MLMEQVAKVFTAANLMTKTSILSIQEEAFFQWLIQDLTQMAHNSLLT